jgi:hypothetical protein
MASMAAESPPALFPLPSVNDVILLWNSGVDTAHRYSPALHALPRAGTVVAHG